MNHATDDLFCNRTLNLRSVRAIGYDMDYTLIQYHVEAWERTAYEHLRQKVLEHGWPVEGLSYDSQAISRGLVVDLQLGNVVKANRFGFVKAGSHGLKRLSHEALRDAYRRTIVDLAEARFQFINTMFSLSETVLYAQLIDILDAGRAPVQMNYAELYTWLRETMDHTHMEGRLKAEILSDPERFVDRDPAIGEVLLDQKRANKRLLLITNSEWSYTQAMMRFGVEPYLPQGMRWRELFDLIIVEAAKPAFFSVDRPSFEVVDDSGLLRPVRSGLQLGGVYLGGDAEKVERCLGVDGDRILYVGDHLFSDIHITKQIQRWRTALVVPEIEAEIAAIRGFQAEQAAIDRQMAEKEALEHRLSCLRVTKARDPESVSEADLEAVRAQILDLDQRIQPLVIAKAQLSNPNWGLIMRTGNDKSSFARQVERYADIYMSRVSKLGLATPYGFLRAARGSLPHDR